MSGEHVTGRQIISALKGHWHPGSWGTCCCPAHDDETPSLSVKETHGVVLVKCHAGCPQEAVIGALRERGLWPDREWSGHRAEARAPLTRDARPERDADELANMRSARAIWFAAKPIEDRSAAWLYLWWRGIAPMRPIPSLRFTPELYCSELRKPLPALVGAVQDAEGRVTAIQRIWLGKSIEVVDGVGPDKGNRPALLAPKKTLGPMGQGAVRLGRAANTIGIAEGIETALAVRKIYSLSVWAALGAGRMANLYIPDTVGRVVIFADNGDAGHKAADRAIDTYEAQGLIADAEFPPPEHGDFVDWLAERDRAKRAA